MSRGFTAAFWIAAALLSRVAWLFALHNANPIEICEVLCQPSPQNLSLDIPFPHLAHL